MNRSLQDNPFPEHLLTIPGFIGDVIKYNLDTAHRKQPILALAAAIALQSVLAARKVQDEYGNRTNLYIVGVAKSAGGKEHARQINKDVLFLSGNGKLEGGEDINNDHEMMCALKASPASLFQMDGVQKNVRSLMNGLYSAANSEYKGKVYADTSRNISITQPCASVYATADLIGFYKTLSIDSMLNGFMGRMLVFEGKESSVSECPTVQEVPLSIMDKARYWSEYMPTAGNLKDVQPVPIVVKADEEASIIFREFGDSIDHKYIENGSCVEVSLWSRALEKANRLALIAACSRDTADLRITVEDARWATELSQYLTQRMMYTASTNGGELESFIESEGNHERVIVEDQATQSGPLQVDSSQAITEIMSAIGRIEAAQNELLEAHRGKKKQRREYKPRIKTNTILEMIRNKGSYGLTDDEGLALLGLDSNAGYRQLRVSLFHEKLIVRNGLKRKNRSGYSGRVWVAIEHASETGGAA
tara:strand:+ start:16337 stop:17767 length:1431 start_codon:yes stop_codon:yes gene_type:complete